MKKEKSESPENVVKNRRRILWELVILFFSILVLLAFIAEVSMDLDHHVSRVLSWFDFAVCLLFLGDFTYKFITAPSKKAYMKWGWLDLISSIPNAEFLRIGRLARVLRVIRIIRGFRATRNLAQFIFENRAEGAFVAVSAMTVTVLFFGALAILDVERDAENANIVSAEDALWWTFVTMTTVGYGDHYPVTVEGRLVAAFVMTAGVGLFGTFTAYVASRFVIPDSQSDADLIAEIRALREKIERLENVTSRRDE